MRGEMRLNSVGGWQMRTLVFAAAFCCAAGAVSAEPLLGTWKTAPDDNGDFGHVQVTLCGEKLCGTLVKSFNASGKQVESANLGKLIVWDMVPQGGGAYAKGKVWSPDRDQTYSSKLQLNDNSLAVEGCVLFVCRNGGTWTRVN
jgi:uncharacterized protein (DUF2147 family)